MVQKVSQSPPDVAAAIATGAPGRAACVTAGTRLAAAATAAAAAAGLRAGGRGAATVRAGAVLAFDEAALSFNWNTETACRSRAA